MLTLLPVLLLAGQATSAQRPSASEPVVQIGVFSYHSDGTAAGSAFGTAERLESTVFASGSLCQLGAGYRDLPAMAAHAWKFTGRVVSASAESAIVQLEWQRIMNQGAAVSEASKSVELTLKAGDRVLLDSVAPQTARGCSVTNAGFEARYMARFAGLAPQLTPAARGGGVGSARAGAGAGTGRGTGAGGGAGAGTGTGMGRGGSFGADAGDARVVAGSRILATAARETADPDALNVELWLVRSVPGGADDTTYQTLRASKEGAMFAFAPISIPTPEGAVSVQITGSFATTDGQAGPRLIFMTARRVSFGPVRGASTDEQGTSRVTKPMPGPDDVLSFELPPLDAVNNRPALPDQFAVRVRIRPAGGADQH
jgi:hypothetical protein